MIGKMYKIPERDKEFGVGKRMGNNLYFHISYAEEILGKRKFEKAKKIASKIYKDKYNCLGNVKIGDNEDEDATVIKYDKKKNSISFIFCYSFNDDIEPGITASICINLNTETGKIISYNKDFPIYHHKWLMVKDNYKGFEVWSMKEIKERSEKIAKIINSGLFNIDIKKIGSWNYWNKIIEMPVILSKMK